MSEFTNCILFLKHDIEKVKSASASLTQPFFIRELNEKWGAIFIKGDVLNSEHFEWLKETSTRCALLCFQSAEDHGWGYQLFKDGVMTARVDVSYELEFNMALDLGEQRFPAYADNIVEELVVERPEIFGKLMDEVKTSTQYCEALAQQYSYKNLQAFAVFGISDEVIAELDKIVSVEQYEALHEPVMQFKKLLGIPEMEWKTYRYLSGDSDDGELYEDE